MKAICQKYDIEPQFIKIELTERICNIENTVLVEIMNSIKKCNFKISLDAFDSEYSIFTVLANIGFDEIKLDKSLIDGLTSAPAIVKAIRCVIDMCNAFRPTSMVVEGIEQQEQIDKLQELNYDSLIVQGYYYSKPIPVDDFLKFRQKTNLSN